MLRREKEYVAGLSQCFVISSQIQITEEPKEQWLRLHQSLFLPRSKKMSYKGSAGEIWHLAGQGLDSCQLRAPPPVILVPTVILRSSMATTGNLSHLHSC